MKINVEFLNGVCYIEDKKSTHSKVELPDGIYVLMDTASPVGWTGEAFLLFLTVSLIEKGQKRNNQTAKGR